MRRRVGNRKLCAEQQLCREAELEQQLHVLLDRARRWGFVVTVTNEPRAPLAMGNHQMVGSVRPARAMDTPIKR